MHDENQMSQNPRSADFPMTWQQQSLDMTGASECQKTWVGQANGGCRLEDLSISQVVDHVTCYKFECSHR